MKRAITETEQAIIKAAYDLEKANRKPTALRAWLVAQSDVVIAVLADKRARKGKP